MTYYRKFFECLIRNSYSINSIHIFLIHTRVRNSNSNLRRVHQLATVQRLYTLQDSIQIRFTYPKVEGCLCLSTRPQLNSVQNVCVYVDLAN